MNLRQKNKALKRQIEHLEVLLNTFRPNVLRPNVIRPIFNAIKVEENKVAVPLDPSMPPTEAQVYRFKAWIRDKLMEDIYPNIEYKITEQAVVGSLFVGKREKE